LIFNSIPVLMYHHVMPCESDLNVTPKVFEEQLIGLKTKGWKTLTADEFLYLITNSKENRKKCVLLTFDDGFVDNFLYAYPILRKYKMKAVLFLATDFIVDFEVKRDTFKPVTHKEIWRTAFSEKKHEVMCTWNELREMEQEGVFDIQSHGHSHKIPDFINQQHLIEEDLRTCKELIKKHLHKEPLHFSWPKGVYTEETIEIAKEIGFKALYTTQRGANINDPLRIKRIAVKGKGSGWLKKKLIIYSSSLLSKIYSKIRF